MKIYHHLPEHKNLFINPVVTIGNFDGVHLGHRKILSALVEKSREKSGEPVVITFSSHPRKVLNPELPIKIITTTEEKVNAIYNFGIPNIILLNFTRQTSQMHAIDFYNEVLIGKLDARYLVIGYDHAFGKNREGNFDFLTELSSATGVEITRIEEEDRYEHPISSTWIRREIESGNMQKANALLGWRYTLSGTVVRGEGRGRTLGFPTANIEPLHQDKIIPGDGVYAVTVRLENETKKNGMLNIGKNPTFAGSRRTIEVNIFDFNEDIYEDVITIEFYEKIRNETAFNSRESLIGQLERDKIHSMEILGNNND
ncbi:MAG TPA: bifunctional riboflavin kinase/FAD synthetase [Spirochaetota bacterium]|nr:bifunctional riboflavin kinase/FAD synthetase [Spirochaetota bacterium]HPN10593.1 bifunctional riboflavin kinase/FAD synthetase [Spirochaetota bacterium]